MEAKVYLGFDLEDGNVDTVLQFPKASVTGSTVFLFPYSLIYQKNALRHTLTSHYAPIHSVQVSFA